MDTETIILGIIGIGAFLGGGLISYFLIQKVLKGKSESIIKEAQVKAEVIKKDKELLIMCN